MNKIGVITYHAAYNYGSVLQAYATQYAVEKLGYSAEIINYRMAEQNLYYSMYRKKFGIKTTVKDLLQIPIHNERMERQNKFEDFLVRYMNLTEEFEDPEYSPSILNKYDTVISGSDQIWNKHSCELERNNWKYMLPYLLDGFKGKKISYASSVANMTDKELDKIIPYLKKFNSISMREVQSSKKLSALLNRTIVNVLDPTFLLKKEDWIKALDLKKNDKQTYILYYSLSGSKSILSHKKFIKKISQKYKCKIKMVTPFTFLPCNDKFCENHPEMGPVDFLSAIMNAEAVISDSYHGTILSINFNKDIYSICKSGGSEFRKTDILNNLGINERIIDPSKDLNKSIAPINYTKVNSKLDTMRENSIIYLKNALMN